MSTEFDHRSRELFLEALMLPPEHRAAFLGTRCAGDEALRLEVQSLLSFHESDERFLEGSALSDAGLLDEGELTGLLKPGARIGKYTVLRLLGAGGMGVVFAAEQESPRRTVALKLMRPGAVSGSAVRRFAREAAALALLQHPAIAQIYEAGADTLAGRTVPYLAMEFVDGAPISAFAREHGLPPRAAVDLMAAVCDGVAHAHSRGVIHRDLKPANVLVTADSRPKILDFGIARLVSNENEVSVTQTQAGQMLGTVAYMAPEQLTGEAHRVDIRADVYALGVILYELLSGRLPLDLSKSSIHEAARVVREEEPPVLGSLSRELRGDLETIARKALEKDPGRRYASAAALAEDLRRFLNDQPILARPPARTYVVKKFVKRNAGLVAGLGAAMTALAAGAGVAVWQAGQAIRERDRAQEETEIAKEINSFLDELLAAVNPDRARGREPTVREALDAAVERLARARDMRPRVAAAVHATLTETYGGLGDQEKSEFHGRRAYELRRAALGPDNKETLASVAPLAEALRRLNRAEESIVILRENLERARRVQGELGEQTLWLMLCLSNALPNGDPEVGRLIEPAAAGCVKVFGPDHRRTLAAKNNLALWYADSGRPDDALRLNQDILEARLRLHGADHPDVLTSRNNVAKTLSDVGRFEEAKEQCVEVVRLSETILGPKHPRTQFYQRNAMALCFEAGDDATGLDMGSRCLAALRDAQGRLPIEALPVMGMRVSFMIRAKQFQGAETEAKAAEELARTLLGDGADEVVQTWTLYYDLYEAWGKADLHAHWAAKLKGTPYDPATYENPEAPQTSPLDAGEDADTGAQQSPGR